MDWNDVRAVFSVIMFALLIGIYVWAWSKNRKEDFNEAANLPFDEPEQPLAMKAVDVMGSNKNTGEKL